MQPFEKAPDLSSSGNTRGFRFRGTWRLCFLVTVVFMSSTLACPRRSPIFFQAIFLFFLESIFQIGESEYKLGLIVFPQEPPHLGDDPVGRRKPRSTTPTLRGASCPDLGSILTMISGSFGGVARDVSQNGIWIRVMCNMESFQRPPRSVPSNTFTISSASSRTHSAAALGETCRIRPTSRARRFLLQAPVTRADKFSD
jgi:hypothetical protein